MDAKDLRIETALGERNDGSKYSQSGVALHTIRNKPYQDIGSNPLAKAEATVRPCAVIGPDRVVPPPSSNEAYLKKDVWTENIYHRPPEYPHKQFNNVNPLRNISPRQTFQENMSRIMVSPTYSSIKHANEANLSNVQDPNATHSKNNKPTMATEAKYCDVPYSVNYLHNEPKNVRETEMCVPSVNSPLTRTAPQVWPPSSVNLHASRMYGAHDVYQYPQYSNCTGPRPQVMPMSRPHRTFPEEAGFGYPDSYYQEASVRFKPYPSVKERYPQARYDYISNYPSPFHPPPPYLPHKYDIPNTRPHPYPMYPHLKYLENRGPEPNIEGYQRPNQNYNMPIRNHIMHPSYQSGIGSMHSKGSSYPDPSMKTSSKPPFDTNKAYVDYENAKLKYSLPEFFATEMSRAHQVQKPVSIPNYPTPGMHPIQMQQYQRKDNTTNKTYEYMPHFRHFEHPIGLNPLSHQTSQFSPSTIAISPTDSNTSNDNHTQVTSQEDCGYVSQSSSASVRSIDSGISRLQNDYYRRHDFRYHPIVGNPHNLPKPDTNINNTKDNSKIDVRQFLSMWNEGDEDNSTNGNSKDVSVPKLSDPNNLLKIQENTKSQDQLYVLGLVNVPNEELAKYEHIQKVSKLPENIKGYNNIELLNQFEEVIEFSNMNNFKSSSTKEFASTKDRKNAIKRMVEVLPRPISPLDVESKISQSVIHKEVGCNFEIKPCSPKMLNVEIASPVQNILGERLIEKVTNPVSYKAKSPISVRIDANIVNNKKQRHESTQVNYENSSCKMVGSPFSANSMEPVKTNYSMQDLETNSGVCLASLPRLDNEIDFNFPEVNQQFINANKGDCNLLEKYSIDKIKDKVISTSLNTTKSISMLPNNSAEQPELTNLSKDRKAAVNHFEHQENKSIANATRKDSVIIENPENVKKQEEKHNVSNTGDEVENSPMNLTQNNSNAANNSNVINISKLKSYQTECALDFSRNKSENELPNINEYDDLTRDMLIETSFASHIENSATVKHENENTLLSVSNETRIKSIDIVNQNSSTVGDLTINTDNATKNIASIHENPDEHLAEYATKVISQLTEISDCKTNTDSQSIEIPISKSKEDTLTKVIVKPKGNKKKYFNCKTIKNEKLTVLSDRKQISPIENSSHNNQEIDQKLTTKYNATKISCDNFKIITDSETEISQNSSTNLDTRQCHSVEKNYEKQSVDAQSNTDISITDRGHALNPADIVLDGSENNITRIKDSIISKINTESNNENVSSPLSVTEHLLDKTNDSDSLQLARFCNNNKTNSLVGIVESKPHFKTSENTIKNTGNFDLKISHDQECYTQGNELNYADKCNINKSSNDDEQLDALVSNSKTDDFDCSTKELVAEKTDNRPLMSNSLTNKIEIADNIGIGFDDYHSIDVGYQSSMNSFVGNKQNSFTNISLDSTNKDSDFKDNETPADVSCVNGIIKCDDQARSVVYNKPPETKSYDEISTCSSTATTSIIKDTVSDIKDYCLQTEITNISHLDIYDKVDANMQILFEQSNNETTPQKVNIEKSDNEHSCSNIETENDDNCTESFKTIQHKKEDHVDGDEKPLRNCEVNINKDNYYENCSLSIRLPQTEVVNKNDLEQPLRNCEVDSNKDNCKKIGLLETLPETEVIDEQDDKQTNRNCEVDIVKDNCNEICTLSVSLPQKESLDTEGGEQPFHNREADIIKDNCNEISMSVSLPQEEVDGEDDKQPLRNCEVDTIRDLIENKTMQIPDLENKLDEGEINCNKKETDQNVAFDDTDRLRESFSNNLKNLICTSNNQPKKFHAVRNTLWTKKKYSPFYQNLNFYNEEQIAHETQKNIKFILKEPTKLADLQSGEKIYSEIDANNLYLQYSNNKLCDESSNSTDIIMPFKNSTNDIITDNRNSISKDFSNFEKDCITECDDQNDLIDKHNISFNYTNNSIITQITETILNSHDSVVELNCPDENYKEELKCSDNNINCSSSIKRHRSLKRSLSDSALNIHSRPTQDEGNSRLPWPPKRNKMGEFENNVSSNRRNSVNFEENVSFCILIDEDCIITEENEDKICITELEGNYITTEIDTESNDVNASPLKELYCDADETNIEFANSEILQCEIENSSRGPWIEDIGCVETIFSDEVAENVVISAPASPTDTSSEMYHHKSDLFENASTTYTDKVRLLHSHEMSYEDAQVIDTLYRTPHMDIMNKTLLYGEKNISDSDNNLSDDLESDDGEVFQVSPTHTPDYIDPTNVSSEFRLETPENKENVFVKELSPLRKIDDYLDVSSAENDNDEHSLLKPVDYFTKRTQDGNFYSCESSLDDVFDYKLKDGSIPTKTSCSTSSSPEVSSTTSEENNSSILLKITNLNGSRVSQINEVEKINRPRCKFTENKEYSASSLKFPNRPLMTKAAQKYIPPIKESIRDLKVKISLPQQRLLKLKQMKLSQSEPKPQAVQKHTVIPRIITKKPKPNFDDVLKSIDEIQFKRHKEKSKKPKTVVPKVVIKKSENGSHYASTPKKEIFNPDLTGRKWQPWVFLEKSLFIDKMATRNKTRAIFSHRKNAYILAEKFKKYKSVSTKFIISQPKTPGEFKYTIRLKHAY